MSAPEYGRSKPGRPKSPPKVVSGPACVTCSHLRVDKAKECYCGHGHLLDATNCTDYRSAAIERVQHGGTSGRKYER